MTNNQPITEFSGSNSFLSNFYVGTPFKYKGIYFTNGEAAFQHEKSVYALDFNEVPAYSASFKGDTPPLQAKRLGRTMKINVADWERDKVRVMQQVIACKFKDRDLANKLLETGHSMLIEGNSWGDQIWGKCDGRGMNLLGVLLMELRGELRKGTLA